MGQSSEVYVMDTSALMEDPGILSTSRGKAVVPLAVIGQLKYLAKSPNAGTARKAQNVLSALEDGRVRRNVSILNTGWDNGILSSPADNRVITTAISMKRPGTSVVLVTTDRNMRIAARNYGILALDPAELSRRSYRTVFLVAAGTLLLFLLLLCA